ncbi:RNA polymerase sigma factor SigI [Paenibacillus sp. NEAU-GSW1]|uniref:RNA polymerase sigma factor SigI n=1 Tax=Paenibacillus sp. NEAU-GSW1 TaxID=2682486 RepID=UPI0020A6ADBA|nr:RNA polymerase sigma factor SigI [Paenibacillus sp. NEAU-GSW1]
MGKSNSSNAEELQHKAAPEQIIVRIKQGDEALREQFIADYKPYVTKVTSRFCKRYIDPSRDDEFSIALTAFNEAINQFSSESGRSFLGFAETVIRRRLIDYVRKEQRHFQSVPYSSFDQQDEEEQPYNPVETRQALQAYDLERAAEERRMEIMEYSKELEGFGVTFLELVECSPKHADSREMLKGIAGSLASNEKLFEQLRTTGKLPVKELTDLCEVSRKTIERNRKYIIAVAFIMKGTYPYLFDYINKYDQTTQMGKGAGL